jgi:iron complex outermembrane recepter protein
MPANPNFIRQIGHATGKPPPERLRGEDWIMTSFRTSVFRGVSSFALAACTMAQPVHAQDDPAAPAADNAVETDADTIVVTAQFREQRLQDTPLAISAISAETLNARGQTNIADVGQFVPNVNLSQSSAINSNSLAAYIRGIGQDDSSFALEPGVGIYIDDVYYGTTFGAVLDLVDLSRVEVLRGPQGTLAGKNSLGGAVKLFTRVPDEDGGGFIQAGTGSLDRINLRGSLGFTLADGLYARASGAYDRRDGYFRLLDYGCVNPTGGIPATTTASDCQTGTQGGVDVLSLRGAVRYAPTGSSLEVTINGDYARNDSQQPATKITYANLSGIAPALALQEYRTYVAGNPLGGVVFGPQFLTGAHEYTSYENYSGSGNFTDFFGIPQQMAPGTFPDPAENSTESWGVTGIIDYALSDSLSLKSITAYRSVEGNSVLDIDGSPISILKQRLNNFHEQFSQEVRLTGTVGALVDFTVGGFYYNANDRGLFRVAIPTFEYDFIADDQSDNRSLAAFANVELHPVDGFNIIGGLRFTDDQKTYAFIRTNPDGSAIPGIPFTPNWLVAGLNGLSNTFADSRWDYRLGVNYRFSPDLMVYAQVSTGFKGGGANPRPFVPDQLQPFGAETVTTYEAGFRAGTGRPFTLNGTYFYNDYSAIQRLLQFCPTSASLTCSQTVNAGDGHSQGVELEAFVRPITGLSLSGSVGYLDFAYDSIDPLTFITISMVAPFNSKWNASASAQYDIDIGNAGTLSPRLDWTYQSSFFYGSVNSPFSQVDGRSLFNARLTYETADSDWQVSAAVTNLTDKFYYVATSENIANFGLASGVVGRPREWSVSVRRRF